MPTNVPTIDEFNALTQRVTALEQSAPPGGISVDGTKLTSSNGFITDDQNDQWRISPTRTIEWMQHGTQAWVPAGFSQSVALIEKWKTTCYQSNTSGGWWFAAKAGANVTWSAANGDPSVIAPTPSGQFSVRNGQIIDPSGKVWIGTGINIAATNQGWFLGLPQCVRDANCNPLLSVFPLTKIVRIPCYDTSVTPEMISQPVNWLTARHIVCSIEYHSTAFNTPSGGQLDGIAQWQKTMAGAFNGNPYVWYETVNECIPDLNFEHMMETLINAIRSVNPNCIIQCMMFGSTVNNGYVNNDAFWNAQHNLIMNIHGYANGTNKPPYGYTGATQDGANQYIQGLVSEMQKRTTGDGIVPVINGEFGDATDGQHVDGNWQVIVTAGMNFDGIHGLVGSTAWFWNGQDHNVEDRLLNAPFDGSTGLTPYGNLMKGLMR